MHHKDTKLTKKNMTRKARLVETYPVQARVLIMIAELGWQPGLVVAHQHPGVWVRDEYGRSWFVTNHSRIRLADESAGDGEKPDEV